MLILTNENTTFDLNTVGSTLTKDVRYGVFDLSDKTNPDYYFRPLVMYDMFNWTGLELRVGDHRILVPAEWSIVVADPSTGDIEVVPLDDVNERDFNVLIFNPLSPSSWPRFMPLTISDVYLDIRWSVPRLGVHNFLVCPLQSGPNPDCMLIINEKEQKKIPQLDLGTLI